MATRIRLKRLGAKHEPHFRIVVAEQHKRRDGSAIEELGYYSPAGSTPELKVNPERAQYWLSMGAQPSDTVLSLLRRAGVVAGGVDESAAQTETADAADAETAESTE